MSGPTIIRGGIAELDDVMPIMANAFDPTFGEAWTRGQCIGMLSLPDVWLLLAIEAGAKRASGFALARRTVDEAELLLIAVLPAARGRGIGHALLDRTAREARGRGAERLVLEVRSTNPALALYAAAGFEQIGRRINYYRGATGALNDALTLARASGAIARRSNAVRRRRPPRSGTE